jgi:hypothetical protein
MNGEPRELTEQMAFDSWRMIADETERLMGQMQERNAFPIEPGSQLAGDDAKSHPYRVSQCAHGFINPGIDHMHALKTLLLDAQTIHAASDWTLLRGALEHFAVAFWILNPSERRVRIARALRCTAKNFRDQDKATNALGVTERSLRENLDEVAEVAVNAGCDKKSVKAGYASTEVLEYVERESPISPSPYVMWQVCSGFAHGRQWANLSINNVEINPTVEAGVSAVRTTTDYKGLLAAGWPAWLLMKETIRLLTERGQA